MPGEFAYSSARYWPKTGFAEEDDNSSHFGENLTSSIWLVLPDSSGLTQALCGHTAWRGRKTPFSGRLIAIVKLKPLGVSLSVFREGVIILRGGKRA